MVCFCPSVIVQVSDLRNGVTVLDRKPHIVRPFHFPDRLGIEDSMQR